MLGFQKLLGTAAFGVALAIGVQKDELGYQDTPLIPGTKWHIHDGLRPQPPVVTPGDTSGSAPSDATVLFDGTNLDAFEGGPWALKDGVMTVNGSGKIKTKESFGNCQLHLEWRAPSYEETGPKTQARGNSGVFFFDRYEIQILDCYDNPTYPDGMTAALYGQYPPMSNACKAPGEWQSYDIMFTAPLFANGRAVRGAFVTVLHNGVCVHHAQLSLGSTQHKKIASYETHRSTGPISIQDHGSPVSFRNIWVRKLEPAQ